MYLILPGQYYDQENNNYYNYKRDYDPSTGRYLESDPLGLAGGINTYLYANANPLSWIDPDGEMAGAVGFGVIVTVGVVTVSAIIVNSQNSWVSPVDDTGPDPMDPDYSPDQCPPEDDDGCKKEMSVCHPICAGNYVAIAGGGNACYRRCMRTCLPAHCADNY